MKTISRAAVLLCALSCSSGTDAASRTEVSNVNVDGQATNGNVLSPTFDVTLDFSLSNDDSCPGCITQLVVGIVGEDQDCAYDGIPGVEPGESGSATLTLSTPTTPGNYELRWSRDLQFNCNDAIAAFPGNNSQLLATVVVPSSDAFATAVRDLNLAGQGAMAVVRPGENFEATLGYSLWNGTSCAGCISQIVLGVGSEGQDCAYDAVPGTSPGESGTGTVSLTAPMQLDTFDVSFLRELQFSCASALPTFYGLNATVVGEVKVGSPEAFETEITANIDGQGTTAAVVGATFDVVLDYQLWNASSCPNCVSQIAIGIDDTGVDCAYNAIPGPDPGTTGQTVMTLDSPAMPGTYELRARRSLEFGCFDALANFNETGQIVLGTIIVPDTNAASTLVRNADIDDQGTDALVLSSQFEVDLEYNLWNASNCPNCLSQIILGIDDTGQDCVYDAIPGVAPGVLAPASLLIDTPAAPGFYDLRWTRDLQFNCAGALANFPNQPLTTFGRIRVGDPNRFETVVKNVNINGQGNRATVAAGEDFQVTLDYALWNDDACPSCRSQIVIGLNDQGLDCAYDSVPGATPGFTGSATLDLEALPTGGTQMLRWARSLELNCADAIAKFSSDTSTPIGEIEAGAALPEIFADGFENRCLNFTALAQPDPIPSSFNPATDPVSIYFANTTSGTGAELNDRARAYLNVVAAGLSNAPAAAYNLEGNTAECGTNESNLALGQARSNAVREFLISQGVGENQLRAVSFGEERPFCVESNVDCWRTNSRVRFVLTSPP